MVKRDGNLPQTSPPLLIFLGGGGNLMQPNMKSTNVKFKKFLNFRGGGGDGVDIW